MLKNSDQAKYGSLLTGLVSQYSMGHNQYPKTIIAATDVLSNHRHDNRNKNKFQNQKNNKNTSQEKTGNNKTSFAQKGNQNKNVVCCCCGKSGHKAPECPEVGTRPKSEWAIRKAELHLQTQSQEDDDSSIESEAVSARSGTSNRSGSRPQWSGLLVCLMTKTSNKETITGKMKDCILLDNCSTTSLFMNPDLVTQARPWSWLPMLVPR